MSSSSSSDETLKKLVDLFVYGSIFRRSTERDWALSMSNIEGDAVEKNVIARRQRTLKTMSALARLISSPAIDPLLDKTEIVDRCIHLAKNYLARSDELIPHSDEQTPKIPVSYAEVSHSLAQIMNSGYPQQPILEFNYSAAIIGGFWDLGNSSKRYKINNHTAMSDMVNNIKARLRRRGLVGDLHILAFGDQSQFDNIDFYSLNMTLVHSPTVGRKNKTSSDKKLIAAVVSWVYGHLNRHEEPANVLIMSNDPAVEFAATEARRKRFRVLLAHGGQTTVQLRRKAHIHGPLHIFVSPLEAGEE